MPERNILVSKFICFKSESHFVKFTAHIKKRSSMSIPEINKLVSSVNSLDLVFLSIYEDHLRKLRREMGRQRIPRALHISR